jgi:hypothetical protein
MTNAQHTTGPWECTASNGYLSAVKSPTGIVARAYSTGPDRTYDDMGAEAEANAHLITMFM